MHSARVFPDPKFLLLLCHTPGNLPLLAPALGTLKSTGFPTSKLEPLLSRSLLVLSCSFYHHLGGLESPDHRTLSP